MIWNKLPKVLKEIPDVFIVGGAVRDFVMGINPHDYDLASPNSPEAIVAFCKNYGLKSVLTGLDHGTISIIINGVPYEHTTFRKDVSCDGRNATVQYSDSLEDDLQRRDFTCNAMAIDKNSILIDNFNGVSDINKGFLVAVGDSDARIKEDYLRIIRAARFASRFNFEIDPNLLAAMKVNSSKLTFNVSVERIFDEFNKAFAFPNAGRFLHILYGIGIIQAIIPEYIGAINLQQNPVYHPEGDVWTHICQVVDRCHPKYRWEAFFHDIGKPSTAELQPEGYYRFYGHAKTGADKIPHIAERLRWPAKLARSVEKVTLHHMLAWDYSKDYPSNNFSDRICRKFRAKVGEHFEALKEVVRADHKERFINEVSGLFRDMPDIIEPVLKGRHLIELGLEPGKAFKELLDKAYNIQIEEGIFDTDDLLRRVL